MSRNYELEDYVAVLDEDEIFDNEEELEECDGHCSRCFNCITKAGYHGRENLVCRITGEVLFEE